MLEKPDYLKISKPTQNCTKCGKSLVDSDRLASVLMAGDANTEEDQAPLETAQSVAPEQEVSVQEAPAPVTEIRRPDEKKDEKKDEEDSGFQRRDYCTKCWNEMKDNAYFSFWIGHRTPVNVVARKLTKAERNVALAALFDSFSDRPDDETDYTPHLFFLAHLLMKYKIFKWTPSAPHPQTGEMMLRFIRAQGGEEVFIRDIDMPDEMVVKIKEDIEAYLQQATGQIVTI